MKKLGLALGGGGAKGLAHIPMLETLDELGIRPHRIAGTSIGAVMGALYASGLRGVEIRALVDRMIIPAGETLRAALKRKEALRSARLFDVNLGRGGGLLKGDRFIQFLGDAMKVTCFEELRIPLRVVATDFWRSEQVVLESGPLLPAVKASMGLPGVFNPVVLDGRVLIDGGGANPLPHDLLSDCDYVVAIDVMGRMDGDAAKPPGAFRAVTGMFDIMQNTIIAQKRLLHPPDLYIKPSVHGIDLLDFHKAAVIYEQAETARQELKSALAAS